MSSYVIRRLLLAVPTLVVLSAVIFVLVSLAPGDPAETFARRTSTTGEVTPADVARARRELRLDRPMVVQWVTWVGGALHGDLGESFSRRTPVASEIARRVPATFELASVALVMIVAAALPLGVVSALFRGRWLDHAMRVAALLGASLPGFFLAYVLLIVFAVRSGLFPVAGRAGWVSVVLPASTLAVGPIAIVSRLLRSSLLEALGEEYIRTARAKGLGVWAMTVRHALPNAAIPVITVLGTVLGGLLGGAVIVEVIFAWPGIGQLIYEAIIQRDYPLVQALVVLAGAVYVTLNLAVDVCYGLLDPQVRYQTSGA